MRFPQVTPWKVMLYEVAHYINTAAAFLLSPVLSMTVPERPGTIRDGERGSSSNAASIQESPLTCCDLSANYNYFLTTAQYLVLP